MLYGLMTDLFMSPHRVFLTPLQRSHHFSFISYQCQPNNITLKLTEEVCRPELTDGSWLGIVL